MMQITRACVAVLLVALLSRCAPSPLNVQARADLASRLDTIRPTLDDLGLVAYRNLSWCRNLLYVRGAYSSSLASDDACNLFSASPVAFDDQAARDYAKLAGLLGVESATITAVKRWPSEGGAPGRLVFTLSDGSSVTYAPGYLLPEAEPGKLEPFRIDSNWYYVWGN
jgi:hypothetical protein